MTDLEAWGLLDRKFPRHMHAYIALVVKGEVPSIEALDRFQHLRKFWSHT